MTFEEFETFAQSFSAVPVYRKVLADLLTPVSAFMRLARRHTPAVLLESVEGGQRFARYSFVGIQPRMIITHREGVTTIQEGLTHRETREPFLKLLRGLVDEYRIPVVEDIPALCGGLVGFLGYETVTWIEEIPVHPAGKEDIPDAVFMLFDTLLAFDHLKQEVIVCNVHRVRPDRPLEEQYKEALARADGIGEGLHADIDFQTTPVAGDGRAADSNMSREQFQAAVEQAREYIFAGDVYQLVLSQRFQRETEVSPLTLYRALRNINPSPYMFLLQMEGYAVMGASPELMVKVEDGAMEVRPIAGTRPRGRNRREDARLAEELLADEKERAEHLMLVDLGRNDVGRVCRFQSVDVKEFMLVERYSHVMHIVSDVQGRLREDRDAFDALMSGFPAGTVTGAPKIRAMELIHELEPDRRGIYTGAIGYLDFHGNLNTCIAIRTLVLKDGVVHFQSGAGIVADSDPAREYEETVDKARAIMQAVDFAERGLQPPEEAPR